MTRSYLTELRTGFDKQTLFKMPLPLHSKWEHSIILISTPSVSYYGASQSNNLLHKSFLEYKIIDEKYCIKADLFNRVVKIDHILYLGLYSISQLVENIAASYFIVFCLWRTNLGKVMSDNLIGNCNTKLNTGEYCKSWKLSRGFFSLFV